MRWGPPPLRGIQGHGILLMPIQKRLRLLSRALLLIAVFLSLLAQFFGARVDADGQLHEAFFLVPLAWFCLLLGLALGLWRWVLARRDARASGHGATDSAQGPDAGP